ncbi:tetratricopeptide repeat protein [Streptomyces sp. NPDC001076]
MAVRKPDGLDPNLELAAHAGDATAMRMLGNYFMTEDIDLAKQWLRAGAEAGDPKAMYDLGDLYRIVYPRERKSPHDQDEELVSTYWLRRAAEARHLPAIEDMIQHSTCPDESEFWLRKAAEGGSVWSMADLAGLLEDKGQATEAEHWYRAAIDHAYMRARGDLASLLFKQDRLAEAERYARLEAQAGSSWAAQQLAEILERLGRVEEADMWRGQIATLRARELEAAAAAPMYHLAYPADVAVTAVVTTAVVPFVQALAAKVAEDTYGQARQLVRRLLRRDDGSEDTYGRARQLVRRLLHRDDRSDEGEEASPSTPTEDGEPGLAILQDPDAGVTLYLWSNASDEALRALSSLDLSELTLRRPDQGQVHLVWHPASGTWHLRGS